MQKPDSPAPASKKTEWLTMLFIIFVVFPLLSVMVVAGYGFAVWILQMFIGPPGHGI